MPLTHSVGLRKQPPCTPPTQKYTSDNTTLQHKSMNSLRSTLVNKIQLYLSGVHGKPNSIQPQLTTFFGFTNHEQL